MKTQIRIFQISLLLLLSFLSLNAAAMYVGNPDRPNTIWIPGHYENGCWKEGYYMKFMCPPIHREQLAWVDATPERKAHWMPVNYVIVNGCNCHRVMRG